jgi:Flp pilus assembly protein CpaB
MEAHRHFGKASSGSRKQGLGDRRTAVLVAAVSAVLAAALIYLFVTHYKKTPAAPVVVPTATVWKATQPIPVGTPESQIAAAGMLKPFQVPASQVSPGAITDPSVIATESTSVAILANQQVTAADFAKTATGATAAALTPFIRRDQRGVAFTLDSEHGLTGFLQPDDTVDVMATNGKGSTELLVKDVTILANSQGIIVLRLTDQQALLVTAATGKYSLWFALRPTVNATNSVQVGAVGTAGSIR